MPESRTETPRSEDRRDRFYRWLLLTGGRNGLAAVLTAAAFAVTFVVAGGYPPGPSASTAAVRRLATSLAGGLLPFVTLVLTINQLALSMELGSVFHLDRRLEAMREFRTEVAELTDSDAAPAEPAALLETLFDGIGERASSLPDGEAGTLADYGDRLEAKTDPIRNQLSAEGDMFDALVAARQYNPGAHLHALERLQSGVESDEYATVLEELEHLHERLDVAQKYFWMIYIEDEMAKLARLVLYTGFVALLAGVALSVGLDRLLELGVGGQALGLVVAAGLTLELLPFAILLAYMLRIATVARTSSGFGPFVTEGPGWN